MVQKTEIETLITPIAEQLGYELVRVQMQGGARPVLQIMAERRDRQAMKVEDCARLSREISPLLDTVDPIDAEYALEVSSPGIDRPLMKLADYARFIGHEAKLELEAQVGGRKRFEGKIGSLSADAVTLMVEGAPVALPLAAIKKAKLILTDRLIADVQSEERAAGSAVEPQETHA